MRRQSTGGGGGGGGAPRSSKLSKLKRRRRSNTPPPVPNDQASASSALPSAQHQPSSAVLDDQRTRQAQHLPEDAVRQYSSGGHAGSTNNDEHRGALPGINSSALRHDVGSTTPAHATSTHTSTSISETMAAPPPASTRKVLNFNDNKTPKRPRGNSNSATNSAAQLRSIFGLVDGPENNVVSTLGSNGSSSYPSTNDIGHGLKICTVHHPIIGDIDIPVVESKKKLLESASKDSRSSSGNNIEFRRSLGINQADISFPRASALDAAPAARCCSKDTSGGGRYYRLGDGLRVPLSPLAFPKTKKSFANAAVQINAGETQATKPPDTTPKALQPVEEVSVSGATVDDISGEIGSICIVSERGATIREIYDIDESKITLGRLHQHSRRSYMEKRWLPPPPPESNEDELDDDDEECVGVMRYRIILTPEDKLACGGADGPDGSPYTFGWISDRGRLACDCYQILEESSGDAKP